MRKKIAPKWVLTTIQSMNSRGVDIYDWEEVKSYLTHAYMFDMLEWIKDNRQLFTYAVVSKQYENVDFYHGEFPT